MSPRSHLFLSRRVITFDPDDFGIHPSVNVMHEGNVPDCTLPTSMILIIPISENPFTCSLEPAALCGMVDSSGN